MTVSGDELMAEAGELLPDAVTLRRKIHANPELGLDLPETTATVLDSLEGIDLEIDLESQVVLCRGGIDQEPKPMRPARQHQRHFAQA